MTLSREACHSCRRQRLKCDRSLPQCLKCVKKGQKCLGYQRLLRWGQGIASRGKMTGVTFEEMTKNRTWPGNSDLQLSSSASLSSQRTSRGSSEVSSLGALTDPLVQDLNHASRKYLFYCEPYSRSCSVPDADQHRLQLLVMSAEISSSTTLKVATLSVDSFP